MKRLLTTFLLALALVLTHGHPALALYQLDFGDTVSVTVKDAPQYSMQGAIRPDGAITVPYLGELEVAGLTPAQLADRIERLVGRFVRNPQVSVTVTGFRQRTVSVFGEVGRQGNVTMPPAPIRPTVMDAIALAGGLTDRANRQQVVLIRGEGPNAQRHEINVEQMLRSGDFQANMEVQDRDKIFVYEVWYPDVREAAANLAIVTSMVTTIALLVTLYNRASGP